MSKNIVSVSECDYLEEDTELRGQKYCCLSFLSPEKVLDDKEVFRFTKFTENFCKDVNELFHNMKEKYPDDADGFQAVADRYRFLFNKRHMQDEYKYFMDEKAEEIDKEFSETVDFQTNVRGIKVRGSYDSMREAQIRSEVLKRKDKNHNIFIAQVGCWCPWDPCADQIDDQHYGEDQLNTLMKKYRENQAHKDEVFDERKDEMLEAQKEKNERVKEQNQLEAPPPTEEDVKDSVNEVLGDVENTAEDVVKTIVDTAETVKDVVNTVNDIESGNVVEGAKDIVSDIQDVKKVVDDVEKVKEDLKGDVNVISSSGIGEDNTIEENFNIDSNPDVNEKVFGGEDPWMKSKGNVEEVD
tara:strand:- start:693 stop:1757 length:1065 start_codon:yes stop_codon:yes gene_type:complete